ncbi:MAG: type IV pilus assembly protein PilM [Candidatus Omnitrophica bacterium]|nr:type IV pilus assembly protein PilM [Candidatus Omnitrophota bacterium]MBU4479256.1 type IV pilus assembly protein PilM [Candidatus Omnitrophota bacterium]MCG2703068.1 type IV pilus assembly protein PilM [Candidatus Omnitrophota bacterium]
MSKLNNKDSAIGLDIGNFSIKAVSLGTAGFGKKRSFSFGISPIPENATNSQISEIIRKTLGKAGITSSRVNIAVSGPHLSYRFIRMPVMRRSELKGALQLELDKYIPFKSEEVIWDCHILETVVVPSVGRQLVVLLVAVKKDFLAERISIVKNAGLEPQLVDIDVLALMNAFNFMHRSEEKKVYALMNMGSYFTNIVVIKKGMPQFARDILWGGRDITQILAERLHLAYSTAEATKYNIGEEDKDIIRLIKIVLENLCNELNISFEYIKKEIGKEISVVYLSGGSLRLYDAEKFLEHSLGLKVKRFNFSNVFNFNGNISPQELELVLPELVVAAGLALD